MSFKAVREFQVNDYIKLKLEANRTNIYIKNRRFMQCMYLLLNIQVDKIEEYDEIESIDEAAAKLSRKMERNHNIIRPEEEFMGHCSNIQAWAENEYDTRLLHRNLAFPLLKALTELGDPIAKKRFKEEIAIRFASGHRTVQIYLKKQGYLKYLGAEELESILDEINLPIIEEIAFKIKPLLNNIQDSESKRTINNSINKLLRVFPLNSRYLILLPLLKKFDSSSRRILTEFLAKKFKRNSRFPLLQFVEKTISYFDDRILNYVKSENKLLAILIDKELDLKNQNIENLASIKGLEQIQKDVEILNLSGNKISDINGLNVFTNLRILNLKNNYISEIKNITNLKKLEILDLSYNVHISEIPESLNELPSLQKVKLRGCRIKKFSESVARFFWMEQNYRFYSNYTAKEVNYYETTHKGKAMFNNKLFKRFIDWLFKIRILMRDNKFSFSEIDDFETKTGKTALRSTRPSLAFTKYLFDRYQTRITSFVK